jgi:hypothetical protein
MVPYEWVFMGLVILLVLGLSYEAWGEHVSVHHVYVIHPHDWWKHEVYDYQMVLLWTRSASDPSCYVGFALNSRGECTSIEDHYDLVPVRLMSVMPEFCEYELCVDDRGIWITAGEQKKYLWAGIQMFKMRVALATSASSSE